MSYLITITGLDEDTQQEFSAQLGIATKEDYEDLQHRLGTLLSAWVNEKYPGIFSYYQIGAESTPGTVVSVTLTHPEARDGE